MGPILTLLISMLLTYWLFIITYKARFYITVFYIPNLNQYINLTTALLLIHSKLGVY